ncbi:pseudouridine synthase [Paraburkholderia phenazinium]|uniref:Dual-specificity RNA pseudouridine synthase RluF n=1 Tax=Paraburkholderia phenazinium TaxID=60549 RepID=A0A1G8LC15_9BURK|nr:pseudouridine synthase [Paraburkholderia phenazinium]SDI53163.1 23S rRNA pseudouridine2604 synthase [Paraburkholderia phenazinium]
MRVKLTAKHPRSGSPERAPVRSGSTTARKPTRPAGPRPATPAAAGGRETAPGGAGKRPAGKPAGFAGGAGRPQGGARPPRAEGSFSRDRDAGSTGAPRRAPSERPPRRDGDAGAPRRFEGERGERAPRKFEGERSERAPRRFEGERGERPPRKFEGERGERPARKFEGERSERAPRRFEGERPARFDRGEGSGRPSFGAPRGPRSADDARGPRAPRAAGGFNAGPRDEQRPGRREREEARERGNSERPRFGAGRSGSDERRSFERPPREEGARRGPPGGRSERPASNERGSSERGERSFANPVKRTYGDRPERAPREDRGTRAPAPRGFGDRPPRAERSERSERTERGARSDRPAGAGYGAGAGARAPRSNDRPAPGSRFAERERPARADKAPRPERGEEAAARPAAHRRDHDDAPGTLRLSKLMSELGLCSRREADEWIENGWVRVDGEKVDTLGSKVRPDQRIEIDPAAQAIQARLVTILIHKPVGYVSGQAEDGYQPAVTLVTPENRWEGDNSDIRFSVSHLRQLAPAGRLDIDSTGLLVLTQDGRIAKRLIGGHSEVEKEYLVRVTYGEMTSEIDQNFPPESLELLRHGLELDDVPLKPAKVSWQNGEQLRFVLREGKKRQIRRMCELVGLEVVGLKRVRMGSVPLGALPPGQWRYLAHDESF